MKKMSTTNSLKSIALVMMLLITFNVSSQERSWTTKTTKDGKTKVRYDIEKVDGGSHMYYIAESNVNTSLEDLDAYFSNSENHKNFLENTPKSEEVEKISNNEWLIYYYFDAPWPISDSDVVAKINRVKEDNKIVFTANVTSSDYNKSDTDRLTTYKFIYEFAKIDDKTTKITINADFISIGSVPKFLIRTWFPKGPAEIIRKLESRN